MFTEQAVVLDHDGIGLPARLLVTMACGLGLFFDSYASVIYALTVPLMSQDLHISTTTLAGLVGSIFLIGYTGGTILFGVLGDRFGRRLTLGVSIVSYGVATAAVGVASGIGAIAGLRALTGIGGAGELSVGFPYVAEVWNKARRCKAIVGAYTFWHLGYFFTIFVFEALVPGFGWRSAYLFALVPAGLILAARLRLEESPRYLAVLADVQRRNVRRTTLRRALAVPLYRRRLIAGVLISIALAYSYYALAFYIAAYVVHAYGLTPAGAGWFTLLFVGGGFLGAWIGAFMADWFGRKRPAIIGAFVGIVVTWLWWQGHHGITTFGALEMLGGGFMGFEWAIGLVFLNEIFPTEIRASGFGWALGLGRVVSIAAPTVTQSLASWVGIAHAIQSSALISVLLIIGYAMLPETQHLEAGDIVDLGHAPAYRPEGALQPAGTEA